MKRTQIIGTGSYIPEIIKKNDDFHHNQFYLASSEPITTPSPVIAQKFKDITGIAERRYVNEELKSSDIGFLAAQQAIDDAGIDMETIDQIIFAHNFGDVTKHTIQTDNVPSLAARVKHRLEIKNPFCVAYDVLFGCPGWLQGVIQANSFFKAGEANRVLVIGSETLSRVLDDHDRDSMIFSDGAGACVLEYKESERNQGILSTAAMSHSVDEFDFINMGKSYFPESDARIRYIKMQGRKVYEYALTNVPAAMKHCADKAEVEIGDIKKIFIHQANEKLDVGVISRFFKLYGVEEIPDGIMPMSVHELGNSSVATVPTLLDRVRKGHLQGQSIHDGDIIMFASVGAGMNINAVCYRV
ncbi:MAG: ketoacyl-ACP synthase III [Salibacteraceae bacterium]